MRPRGYFIQEDLVRQKKWAYLTEGLKDQLRLQCEMLMENQERHDRNLNEAQTSMVANLGVTIPGALGLIRATFPRLIAQELLSVQPADRPVMKAFYLDFKYGTTAGDITAADKVADGGRAARSYAKRTLETDTIRDLYLDIADKDLTAEEWAIKVKWTLRLQQDLMAYHGLNAETELMAAGGDEIVREIDTTLIEMMVDGATAGNVNWNVNLPSSTPWTLIDPNIYKAELYKAMVDANNLIYKKRYRDATWAVADADTCTRLEKLEGFKLEDVAPEEKNIGVYLFGTFKNRWKIYKDAWFRENTILMGYKGADWKETGAVYMPYIPFYATPLLIDPDDNTPRRGIMSRGAMSVLIGDCYATVSLVSS